MNSAQKRYHPIEIEATAVLFACTSARYFLEGLDNFEVLTDHKPLVGIFQKHIRDVDNPRIQNVRIKLMRFNLTVMWVPGKYHMLADALSRRPMEHEAMNMEEGEETWARARKVSTHDYARKDLRLQELFEEAGRDTDYMKVAEQIKKGGDVTKLEKDHPA